ncbi:DUF4158 domain-containing protein [Nocardia asteroides]|nr:DUF4158 domain-containing protein [Nocardia asteroides]
MADDAQPTLRVAAHCRRCGGWLLSPPSVAQGIGPTCAVRERAELLAAAARRLGFVPDRVADAPPVAVARLAEQLDVDASMIRSYGKRAQTRTEHVRLVAQYLRWRPAGAMELKATAHRMVGVGAGRSVLGRCPVAQG